MEDNLAAWKTRTSKLRWDVWHSVHE